MTKHKRWFNGGVICPRTPAHQRPLAESISLHGNCSAVSIAFLEVPTELLIKDHHLHNLDHHGSCLLTRLATNDQKFCKFPLPHWNKRKQNRKPLQSIAFLWMSCPTSVCVLFPPHPSGLSVTSREKFRICHQFLNSSPDSTPKPAAMPSSAKKVFRGLLWVSISYYVSKVFAKSPTHASAQ